MKALKSSVRRCQQGKWTCRSKSLATWPSVPRFRRSSSAIKRYDGQTGSQRSGVRLPRSLSLTWRGSGPPWKIRSPGSQSFPRATPSHPKMSTEAVVALAQPPNWPMRKEVPQWTPRPLQHQRLQQHQRRRPQRAEAARRSSGGRSSSSGTSEGGGNWGRVGGGGGGGGEGSEERLNSMAYNNTYVDGRWVIFRHVGLMRLITRKASLVGVKLPVSTIDPT